MVADPTRLLVGVASRTARHEASSALLATHKCRYVRVRCSQILAISTPWDQSYLAIIRCSWGGAEASLVS